MLLRLLGKSKSSYKRLENTLHSPEFFLKKYSGKIIGVGDIFDLKRSAIVGEKEADYVERTHKWWQHIEYFVLGNHDSALLKRQFKNRHTEYYRVGPVLALHGHQLKFTFNQAKILEYEKYWDVDVSTQQYLHDIEEWIFSIFNKFFTLHGKKAYTQARSTIEEIDKKGLLTEETRVIITGHTHLPFRVKLSYKGKRYRVVNCGSTLHGKKFNPVYVKEIDRWFISDLHLGTIKSVFDF